MLNDILNETASEGEWKKMKDEVYGSSKASEVVSSQYSDLMNNKPTEEGMITSMGIDPNKVDDSVKNALTKDYSALVEKMNKQPRGKISK